jgi:DNA repair exonuclease SbcCD ATPase subunit
MLDAIKKNLQQARKSLASLADEIEDGAEDFAEEAQELWGKSKTQIDKFNQRLEEAAEKLHSSADETRLQGHLAAMDAHDQWQHLQHNVAAFAHQLGDKTKPTLDHAQLQAHLAKMDARDFVADSSKDIAAQFEASKTKVEEATFAASASLQKSCEGLIAGLPK